MSNWLKGSRVTPPVDLNEMIRYSECPEKVSSHFTPSVFPPVLIEGKESKKRFFQSSRVLRWLSVILHVTLVALHLILIGISTKDLEHQLVFPLDTEKNRLTRLVISIVSTTFVTIYSAVLVFVTQTLWMRRSVQRNQTLTETHDHAAAWAGIGAAISHIWHQQAVRASIMAVLCVCVYLGNIMVLHITTPALFSLATFNSPTTIPVGTQSLPSFTPSPTDDTDGNMIIKLATDTLYVLPSVKGHETNLGLYEGTLFDVLDINNGTGNATMNATGFDFTCGYLTDLDQQFNFNDQKGIWMGNWISEATISTVGIYHTRKSIQPGMLGAANADSDLQSIVFYSTIPIVDSNGTRGPLVRLQPSMNYSVDIVQVFQCTHTLINQTATVDAQSRQLQAVVPDLHKPTSTWGPGTRPTKIISIKNIFDLTPLLFSTAPPSDIPRHWMNDAPPLNLAEFYLAQKLDLFPSDASDDNPATAANITVHDVENALSEVLAAMFWTVGHTAPVHGIVDSCGLNATTLIPCIDNTTERFPLLRGTAIVTEIVTKARLDLSLIAVGIGLAASVALLLLSLPTSVVHKGSKDDTDIPVDGTGLLHVIWMYRNHPELETLLRQVDNPTTTNLPDSPLLRRRLPKLPEYASVVRRQGWLLEQPF
ncbi:hypothetical protein B0H19DRAFT_1265288 [Mycena capillaripes]|nr:hypothetical protein B0H19DRAFT_1265288 [Mycena capillaripes]